MRFQKLALLIAGLTPIAYAQQDEYNGDDSKNHEGQDLLDAMQQPLAFPASSNVTQSTNLNNSYTDTTSTYGDLSSTLDLPAYAACQDLLDALPSQVAFPASSEVGQSDDLTSLYSNTTSNYWDLASTLDVPACIVFPSNAADVSRTVQILQAYDEVQFNLKSGGHNFNRGFSSVDRGVLISFRPYMQDTIFSEDTLTASVGPGARWQEAVPVVEEHGRAIVGGRAGHVGVGGYIILGGLSYLSGQYVCRHRSKNEQH